MMVKEVEESKFDKRTNLMDGFYYGVITRRKAKEKVADWINGHKNESTGIVDIILKHDPTTENLFVRICTNSILKFL